MTVDNQKRVGFNVAWEAAHLTNADIDRKKLTGLPAQNYADLVGDLAVNAGKRIVKTEKKAGLDQLTEVFNRLGLQNRIKEMIGGPQNFLDHDGNSLVGRDVLAFMIDLDYFKKFNDKFGHGLGDEVLHKFAQELIKSVHDSDVIARLGGEEFGILIFGQDRIGDNVFEEIDKRLTDLPVETGRGKTKKINFSAGATIIPWQMVADIANADERNLFQAVAEAFRVADQALYQAKQQGRGRLVIKSK